MLEKIASANELSHEFDPGSFSRGLAYFRDGRVLESKLEEHGDHDVVTGLVRGSGAKQYQVHILIEDGPGGISVDGDCSCPVGFNCKHVVSTLMDRLENQNWRSAVQTRTQPREPRAWQGEVALDRWLGRLEKAVTPLTAARYPPHQTYRLVYVIRQRTRQLDAAETVVEPLMCRQLKQGGYGKPAPFSVDRAWQPHPPDYLLPEDIEILRRLAPEPFALYPDSLALQGETGARVLKRLVSTGRCHWLDKDAPALKAGTPRRGTPDWELRADGQQQVVFRTEPAVTLVIPSAPPWYIDLEDHTCGPLETDLPPALAGALAGAPPVNQSQVRSLRGLLEKRFPGASIPPPHQVQVKDVRRKPIPWLRLCQETLTVERGYLGSSQRHQLTFVAGQLGFDYGGHRVEYAHVADAPLVRDGDRLLRVRRDKATEAQAYERLVAERLAPLSQVSYHRIPREYAGRLVARQRASEDSFWLAFQSEVLPELQRDGWRVEVDDSFPYSLVVPEEWYGDLEGERGGSWFDLELGVVVDGRKVSLLPLLANWLRGGASKQQVQNLRELPTDSPLTVRLEDGTFLTLPVARVRTILENLLELYDPDVDLVDGKLRLPALRAAQVSDMESAADTAARWRWLGGQQLRELSERLQSFQGLAAVEAPSGFKATLRRYQQEGLAWLQFLREYQLGGVLADDMGLGKTVQTLAHVLAEKQSGRQDRPSLVIAPTSLMVNWRMEAQRFAPELVVLTLHGPARQHHFGELNRYDLILTTYALLPRDRDALCAGDYHLLILDEAQNIKNSRAKASQIVHQISARHRLCLTGTPMENHLGELWSLFHFLQPGLLGDQRQFRRLFRTPIEKHRDHDRQATLSRRVAPFMLRRTKDEVAKELPSKTVIERDVELHGGQRDLYESIRIAMHDKVRKAVARQGMERSHIVILDALLKLRQVCCDPRLVKLERARTAKESAKLGLLMDLVPEMVEEGRRILVFSQFTTMLGLIEEELRRHGLQYVKLTGRTRDRATPIAAFQAGEVPIFLISLKAGGTGLNLTAADTVIHYDPWWNPAVENQATDRAHRLGQHKPVFVYRLITTGTVEEKMIALQAHKRELADALFAEGGANTGRLSGDDLQALFEPLAGDA